MRSSIPCSSSRRRAARSTYSRDQILSRTFWGTVDCHFTLLVQWPKSSVIGPKCSVTGPKALLLAPKALLLAPKVWLLVPKALLHAQKGLLVTCMLCRWPQKLCLWPQILCYWPQKLIYYICWYCFEPLHTTLSVGLGHACL